MVYDVVKWNIMISHSNFNRFHEIEILIQYFDF